MHLRFPSVTGGFLLLRARGKRIWNTAALKRASQPLLGGELIVGDHGENHSLPSSGQARFRQLVAILGHD